MPSLMVQRTPTVNEDRVAIREAKPPYSFTHPTFPPLPLRSGHSQDYRHNRTEQGQAGIRTVLTSLLPSFSVMHISRQKYDIFFPQYRQGSVTP